ncbi:MAG TPA: hypothetical protein VMV23_01830 [Candidatus Nanopelagicaceae bacterium]|nr:hypothetical protein [Candidatus Nanopelagicaceae bacterium]
MSKPSAAPGPAGDPPHLGSDLGGAADKPPLTPAELAAKEDRRRRGLQVSTFCLHTTAWVVLTYYATDYLPPLSIRLTVGLTSPRDTQYLVGYTTLSLICLLLGAAFAGLYRPRIAASRYPWRWFLAPLVVALILIPSQGANGLLTKLVEAACLTLGLAVGQLLAPALRPSPGSSERDPAAAR